MNLVAAALLPAAVHGGRMVERRVRRGARRARSSSYAGDGAGPGPEAVRRAPAGRAGAVRCASSSRARRAASRGRAPGATRPRPLADAPAARGRAGGAGDGRSAREGDTSPGCRAVTPGETGRPASTASRTRRWPRVRDALRPPRPGVYARQAAQAAFQRLDRLEQEQSRFVPTATSRASTRRRRARRRA